MNLAPIALLRLRIAAQNALTFGRVRHLAFVLGAAAALVTSTSQASASDHLITGRVLSTSEVRAMTHTETFVGDDSYAVLDSSSLAELQRLFECELRQNGASARDGRSELTSAFIATAQMAFVVKNWRSRTKAKAIAVGEAWLSDKRQHCESVVVAITERGMVFWDPARACELKAPGLTAERFTLCRI